MQILIRFFFYCVIQWTDCQAVGRDLVRLLQNVARIPEFEKLWRDMMLNPSAICPSFTGELWKGKTWYKELDDKNLMDLLIHLYTSLITVSDYLYCRSSTADAHSNL